MSESASIFLTGEIVPGFLKEDVISPLARLLKTDEHKAAALLSGRETLIKRNAASSDVDRYIQALHKVGAVARSEQPRKPSTFPVLAETIIVPTSAPAAPATKQEPQVSQAPRELALAPGWSKPGEETVQVAAPSARTEQAVGAGLSRSAGSGASRQRTTAVPRDQDRHGPVYAHVPVFGLSTQGRIGRLRYLAYFWPTMGLMAGAGIVAALLIPALASARLGVGSIILAVLFGIVLLWMSLRVTALRLHDLNKSGKWVLLPIFLAAAGGASGSPWVVLIASAGSWILYIALMIWPGSQEDNEYGPPPAPNTEGVYIGAALFLGCVALGVMGMAKYDAYAWNPLSRGSADASNADSQGKQTDAIMRNYAKQMDAQTPVMISPMLSLDKVEYADSVLRYKATIQGKGLIIGDDKMEALKKSLLQSYCGQGKAGGLFPSNKVPVDFIFRYQVTAWDYDSFTLQLSPESC